MSTICLKRNTHFRTKKTCLGPMNMSLWNGFQWIPIVMMTSKDLRRHNIKFLLRNLTFQNKKNHYKQKSQYLLLLKTDNLILNIPVQVNITYWQCLPQNFICPSMAAGRKVLMILITLIALMTSKWVTCQGNLLNWKEQQLHTP